MKKVVALFGLLLLVAGCSHQLQVKNLADYEPRATMHAKDLCIGVYTESTLLTGKSFVDSAAQKLQLLAKDVVYPCFPSHTPEHIDVLAKVTVKPDHKGSIANFFISFPGFLIWTPAWNGYVYKPSYNVRVDLVNTKDGSNLESFNLPINLNIRHADMGRTGVSEGLGWFFWGAPAFIGGFFHTAYDDDVTSPTENATKDQIGSYLAQEIVNRINNHKNSIKKPKPMAFFFGN